jgi:hypothetical protein
MEAVHVDDRVEDRARHAGRAQRCERRAVLDEPRALAVVPDEVRNVVHVGWPPVASDERQTGVNDGNVDTARAYCPCSARNDSAGARPSPTAASNTDGVKPSMTIRIAF